MPNKLIIGRTAKGEDVHSFRERKLDLKAGGYPVDETRDFVKEYYLKVQDVLHAQIDRYTLLIKVPSGSGVNGVTHSFANLISKSTGAGILPDGLIKKTHQLEAKNNLSLEKRNMDPINYKINAAEIKEFAKGYNKVLVIDDLIGSGESAVKVMKLLERGGIEIKGLANLITIEKNYPSIADLTRVQKKITEFGKLAWSDTVKLEKNLRLVFSDYTRQKLNRFERPINDERTALKAFKTSNVAASIEKNYNKSLAQNLSL